MAALSSSTDWAVYQFFNTPYDPVSAAYWSEPQQIPQREEHIRQPKMNTVEIKCLMCCEGCKKSVKRALGNMMGVNRHISLQPGGRWMFLPPPLYMCFKAFSSVVVTDRGWACVAGVSSFKVSTESSKVTVSGESIRAEDVLKVIQKASKKKTELWPEKRFFGEKRTTSRLD